MSETQAWWWVDTHGAVTSKFTLVRFGVGTLSDGTTETAFTSGEATIEEPVQQVYEAMRGSFPGAPSVPGRVDITLRGIGAGPESAMLYRLMCSLTADGLSVPQLFVTSLSSSATWEARAVGGTAVVGMKPQPGPPPDAKPSSLIGNVTKTADGVTLWLPDGVRVSRPVRDDETAERAADRLLEEVADYVAQAMGAER